MNILLISPYPPPGGGIATWTRRYMDYLKNSTYKIHLVNTSLIGKRLKDMEKRYLLDEVKRSFSIIRNVEKILKSDSIDIMHINCPCGTFVIIRDYICGIKAKKNKTLLLIHFRCDIEQQLSNKISVFFFKKLVNISDKAIALNSSSKLYLQNVAKKDSVIIPNFVSNKYADIVYQKKEISNSFNRALYVGHVLKSKGCDLILDIAKKFPEKKFVFLGLVTDDYLKRDNPKNCFFLGEVDFENVIEEMKKADVFLFPTHTEGFSNALVEAMACGLPVITTDVGANKDMIEDKGGYMIRVENKEDLCKSILKMESYDVRKKMSEFNQKKVEKSYMIDDVVDSLIKVYEGM